MLFSKGVEKRDLFDVNHFFLIFLKKVILF